MLKASEARERIQIKESGEYKRLFSLIESEINESVSNFKRKTSIDDIIYDVRTLLYDEYGYTCSVGMGTQYNETYKTLIIEW